MLQYANLNKLTESKKNAIKMVNGYEIVYNPAWRTFQVSHKKIGANIAEFNTEPEAISYAKNG